MLKNSIKVIKNMPAKVLLVEIVKALGAVIIVAYLFYKSFIAAILLCPAGYLLLYRGGIRYEKKRNSNINSQFKDGLLSISGSLSAGYSLENAIKEAVGDIRLIYGKKAVMAAEFESVVTKVGLNRNIEDAIYELAVRIDDEDAYAFAEVLKFAKRSGGDLVSIIKNTAHNIEERQKVREEIRVMIASKKFEQSIMNIIPFGIIMYLNVAMPGMLDALYHNAFGVMIMSVSLGLYIGAIYISERIMSIEV